MAKNTTTKTAPAANAPMIYRIEVFVKGQWKPRTERTATSPNAALRAYGLRGTRPRLGQASSKSGRRFRAINTGRTA